MIATTTGSSGSSIQLNYDISKFSAGSVSSFSISPISDNLISANTDFQFSFKLSKNLYIDSYIDVTLPSQVS